MIGRLNMIRINSINLEKKASRLHGFDEVYPEVYRRAHHEWFETALRASSPRMDFWLVRPEVPPEFIEGRSEVEWVRTVFQNKSKEYKGVTIMFLNQLKTLILLSFLSGLFLLLGHWLGGSSGLIVAFVIAIMMNLFTYFLSDKMVLAMYGAQPLDPDKYKKIYCIVEELCQEAQMPMPKLWLIPGAMANAFATGRNPEHSSVAVTEGIIDILEDHELRGVIAHELSHIKNRDILIATIAATVAMAIGYLAHMMQWAFIFGGREERERGGGMGALLVAIIMPIAATLIQLAISRSREYLADETGAHISHDPLALASALEKLTLDTKAHETRPESTVQATTASLFIVYPFSGGGWLSLFSTHPPMEKRIERLKELAKNYY